MLKTYVFYCNKCRKNIVVESHNIQKPTCCGNIATLHAIKVPKTNNIPDYVKEELK